MSCLSFSLHYKRKYHDNTKTYMEPNKKGCTFGYNSKNSKTLRTKQKKLK